MKKKIVALVMSLTVFATTGMTTYAAENATVSFTPDNKLEYSGVMAEGGEVNLGSAFEGVAPGETRTQTITVKNDNKRTADFYMSAETVKALEEETASARGAGYDIKLTVGSTTLYDSTVGGYKADSTASAEGIGGMNDALKDYVLIGTLKNGQSLDVVLQIAFDGEAMDNTSAIDYSLTNGKLAFDFQVGYEDPSGSTVIIKEVTEGGAVKYVKKVVQILDEEVPLLGAVKTGDEAMIGIAVIVLAAGAVMMIFGKKKKVEEEA